MFPKKYFRYGFIIILTMTTVVFVIGCSHKLQPKGWLSVEKPPIRVVLVDSEKDINQAMVHMIIDHVNSVPYHDYKFNPTIGVSVTTDYSVDRNDNTSSTISVGGK